LLSPGCTGCKACSQICPDFVFQVYKYETPLELPVPDAATRGRQ
jgi:2-oxoglutarate ferredoxin oxidoreductase subunit delta